MLFKILNYKDLWSLAALSPSDFCQCGKLLADYQRLDSARQLRNILAENLFYILPISWTTTRGQSKRAASDYDNKRSNYSSHHHNKFDAMKMKMVLAVVLFCHLSLISGGRKYLVKIENKVEI